MSDEFEASSNVERIVGRRFIFRNKPYYLIEWKGYSKEHNTWESADNLLGNTHLVTDFITEYKRQHQCTTRAPRTRILLKDAYDTDPDLSPPITTPRRPKPVAALPGPSSKPKTSNRSPKVPAQDTARVAAPKPSPSPKAKVPNRIPKVVAQDTPQVAASKSSPSPIVIESTPSPRPATPLSTPPSLSSVSSTPNSSDTDENWMEAWSQPVNGKKRPAKEQVSQTAKRTTNYSSETLAVAHTPALPGYQSLRDAVESEQELEMILDSMETARRDAASQRHLLVKNKNGTQSFAGVKPPVFVKNELDDTAFPDYFVYVNDLVIHKAVIKPSPDFLSGCECTGKCKEDRQGAAPLCHENMAYGTTGRLRPGYTGAIYECNEACSCDARRCPNRMVQLGRQVPLDVFKTAKKGWGVRTVKALEQGTFVEQYLGEVISDKDGVQRGKIYDRIGISYLFNMDIDGQPKNVIDSYLCGNASHYLNHSCDPNLVVFGVFYDSVDPSFHRLAFFTKRAVAAGEELTFDYIGDNLGDNAIVSRRFPCYCASTNCRKWIHL